MAYNNYEGKVAETMVLIDSCKFVRDVHERPDSLLRLYPPRLTKPRVKTLQQLEVLEMAWNKMIAHKK
jgi:hypothetical protein